MLGKVLYTTGDLSGLIRRICLCKCKSNNNINGTCDAVSFSMIWEIKGGECWQENGV